MMQGRGAAAVVAERAVVLRLLGYAVEAGPRVADVLSAIEADAPALVRARWRYRRLGAEQLRSSRFLRQVESVVLCAVTIGPPLERRVEDLQRRGEIARALVLDAWGSAAVEAATERAERVIAGRVAALGLHCSRRFSPGYGGWSVQEQPWVLEALGGEETGLDLTRGGMLVPRKSTTFAVTVGDDPPEMRCTGDCDDCDVPHCRFRQGGVPPKERGQAWWTAGDRGSGS